MKNSLLLSITFIGISFKVFAQMSLDSNDIFSNSNAHIAAVESINTSSKSTSNSPIIINTIQSPTQSLLDIAFDGENLWVEGFANYILYKISPIDGSILKTIPTSIERPYGLEFANGCLWVADADNKLIQQVDTSDGNVISSFSTPSVSTNSYPQGLAWDGQNLWQNDAMGTNSNPNDSTYKITNNGQILESHHAFGTYVTGLAWDGQFLWSSDNPSQEIYKIDVASFTVVDTLNAPGGLYPNGLAFDGQYLWVANSDSDSLYQIDIGIATTAITHNTLTNALDFAIYPNPASDAISIKLFNNKVGSTYTISDQTDKQITSGKINDKTTIVDIKELAVGIYLFQVGENSTQSFKVIKK